MQLKNLRVSAVKYANTYPFIFGLTETGFDKKVFLETDHPAVCAAKVISGKADIGLIPVGALPFVKDYSIISDYCIGSNGRVRTVMLLSNSPLTAIKTVYLDYRSRTSVNLVKVLAKNKWKKNPEWINTTEGFDFLSLAESEGVVLIGDQCFEFENKYNFKTDLSEEWKEFSGLPFVFACWASNRKLDKSFTDEFNEVMKFGVHDIPGVVKKYGSTGTIRGQELKNYLTTNIDYNLNSEKKRGMELFLKLMSEL